MSNIYFNQHYAMSCVAHYTEIIIVVLVVLKCSDTILYVLLYKMS